MGWGGRPGAHMDGGTVSNESEGKAPDGGVGQAAVGKHWIVGPDSPLNLKI